METYKATDLYDALGNMLKLIHQAASGNWARGHHYNTALNNFLLKTSLPGDDPDDHNTYSANYTHDAHGNITAMPHLQNMQWDYRDQLREVDLGGGGTAYYVYSEGQRVRKVIVNGTLVKERIYLGGFEVYREYVGGSLDKERESFHIMDDKRRIALVETLTVNNSTAVGTPTPVIKYQLGNHLDSASLELDASANVITYEEYHPFGSSSYRLGTTSAEVSLKRYRYVGKEKDDETGLYYYGARYYADWLCRFVSVDPLKDDYPYLNSYNYAGNKPITHKDMDGLQSTGDEPVENNVARQDNTRVVTNPPNADNLKNVEPAEANVYQINKETGAAEKIDVSGLDLSERDQTLLKGGGEFIYRNNRLSLTSKETLNALNNPSEAGPLTEFALGKLKEDFKTYEGNFPENYYEDFGKAVVEKSIELSGADMGMDAVKSFVNKDEFSEGMSILHAYESYVTKNADTGFDKAQHFIVSAVLQYKYGSLVTDALQNYKETQDEVEMRFGIASDGRNPKDMLANNRGQAFGKLLKDKYHPKPAEPRFRRFGE